MSNQIQSIKVSEILADEAFNCRGAISPVDVADLARSIEQLGRPADQPLQILRLGTFQHDCGQ